MLRGALPVLCLDLRILGMTPEKDIFLAPRESSLSRILRENLIFLVKSFSLVPSVTRLAQEALRARSIISRKMAIDLSRLTLGKCLTGDTWKQAG